MKPTILALLLAAKLSGFVASALETAAAVRMAAAPITPVEHVAAPEPLTGGYRRKSSAQG